MHPIFRNPDRFLVPAVAIGFAVLGLIVLSVFNTWAFPIDDAFISFRYARNLLDGFGLVFNHGDRVEAYSNFLWTLLVSALGRFGLSQVLAARVLGLASLTTLCLLLLVQLKRTSRGVALPFAVTLAFMLFPATVFHTLSGMETVLSAMLLVAAGAVLEAGLNPRRKAWLAGLCLGLFSLNRPEGLLLFACILAGAVAVGLLGEKDRAHPGLLVISFACLLLPFLAWRFFYYGTLLPNSVLAKSGFLHSWVLKVGAKYLGLFLFVHAPIVLFAFLSFFRTRRAALVGFRLPASVALTTTALLGGVGDGYPYSRYLYPLLACLVAWSFDGGLALGQWGGRNRRTAGLSVLTLLCGIQLVLLTGEWRRAPLIASQLKTLQRPIAFFGDTPQSANPLLLSTKGLGHHQAGQWLREHASPGDLLAAYEIGIVPYVSRLPVLDLFGLADRHIARARGLPGHRADLPYIWGRKPAYIMLRLPSDCLCSDDPIFFDPRLRDDYDLAALFPYWTTHILLFKRRAGRSEIVRYEPTGAAEYIAEGPIYRLKRIQLLAGGQREETIARISQTKSPEEMRRWIGTWRNVFALLATPEATRGSVSFKAVIPQEAGLVFGIGTTRSRRSWSTQGGQKVRVTVVASDGRRTETVFDHNFERDETTAGWEDFRVKLRGFDSGPAQLSFTLENQGIPIDVGLSEPHIIDNPSGQ